MRLRIWTLKSAWMQHSDGATRPTILPLQPLIPAEENQSCLTLETKKQCEMKQKSLNHVTWCRYFTRRCWFSSVSTPNVPHWLHSPNENQIQTWHRQGPPPGGNCFHAETVVNLQEILFTNALRSPWLRGSPEFTKRATVAALYGLKEDSESAAMELGSPRKR